MRHVFVALLTLLFGCGINGQDSEGVPCETPNEEYGLCISIYNCSSLMDLLINQSHEPRVRTFLRSSTCGYLGSVPLVCCPDARDTENPLVTSSSTTGSSVTPTRNPKNNKVYELPRRPNCGTSNHTLTRIVNGVPALLGEYPWIVALGYRNKKNPESPKWLCGGSLITDRHILTAAHCVYNRQDLYLARLGDLDLYSDDDKADPETIPLIKAKVHEDYSAVTFSSDIAILTLERSPRKTTAWPICLPIDDTFTKYESTKNVPIVAGWGSIYFNGPSSSYLVKVLIPVIDNELCKRAYGNRSIIDDRVLCAGYLRGGKDACQGDSGGPLMQQISSDENRDVWFFQRGLVSYGLRCAEAGYPGVYTRVSAFLDWIQRNIN